MTVAFQISRRDLLGAAGAGIVVLFGVNPSTPWAAADRPGYPDDFHAYLSIGSNGRSVALAATRAADAARRDVVLTAAAGRNLVREADCVPDAPAPAARVTCTAAMP